ncbi:MAG: hypothetical protein ABI852_00225 [Gemmatimonadaceae bacterium]
MKLLVRTIIVACIAVFGIAASAPTAGAQSARNDTALLTLLRTASTQNRLPNDLMSYSANTETEVAFVLRQGEGTETVATIEQMAGTAQWRRGGTFEQHITGHRSQQLSVSVSALSFMNAAWITPVLYGNRMRTRVGTPGDSTRTRRGGNRAPDTIAVIHPLAVDRERYYTYSGGDTIVILRSDQRQIPIVRVHVEPRADLLDTVAIFVGDMDLDASRGTLVRLRGHFIRVGKARLRRFGIKLVDAIAYIEFENAEREGKYWLPAMQRVEVQLSLPMLGDERAVLRLVTRFPSMAVNDTVLDSTTIARADSARSIQRRLLTYASGDSMSKYTGWKYPLGAITAGLHSDDFNDIAPDRLRPTGKPRFDLAATRLTDIIHYNRVEGLYTGLGVKLALRDVAPGVVVRANAGWAWKEQTARGRISVDRTRGLWFASVRAGRSLDITNDFRNALDSGATLGALGSNDPYDYVDRRSAGVGLARYTTGKNAVARIDYGYADDRYSPTRLKHGLFGSGTFSPNRGVDEGGYRRLATTLEWHPRVNAEAVQPGYSARLYYERADGTISYQRAELRVISRKVWEPFTWVVRGDAGEVFGKSIPPQQLFELGHSQNLPGYDNKAFAGSRAAVFRTNVLYASPFLRQPIRLTRNLWLPAIAPGLSAGIQSGWTDARTQAARASIFRLGQFTDSLGVVRNVSRETNGIRATTSVGLRFFSGAIFTGFARAIDHPASWHFIISGGRTL